MTAASTWPGGLRPPFDFFQILQSASARWPDRPALLVEDSAITYRDLLRDCESLAAGLSARGVGAGDRVLMCLGNQPEWIVAFFALSRLRASAVLASTSWRAHEIAHAMRLTAPMGAIVDGGSAPFFDAATRPALALCVGAAEPGWEPYADVLTESHLPGSLPGRTDDPAELELVLPFSSGTTGLPKAVVHTHRSACVATEQWRAALDVGETDRLQAVTPLSHILGIVNVGATFAAGATIRLFRKFSPRAMVQSFQDDRITIGVAVAPIAAAIAAMADLESYDLSSLRYLNWSATPVNQDIARTVTERTGVRWAPAYGTTEVPILAVSPVRDLPRVRLDSVGLLAPWVQMEAVDPATGRMLPRGETGELVAASPAAMSGYLPVSATSPFLDGTWYRTGDIGYVEAEGWVFVTDRFKDLIKVSGFQVSPVEIEAVLLTSPAVADCAVYGQPDPRTGEAPCAVVVLADGARPDPDALRDWLAPLLASYKRVRDIRFVESIPRTASGKVQRRLLAPEQA